MSGLHSRNKGKRWEREVASRLRDLGYPARRGWQARAGTDACDVEGTDWWVECKHGKKVNYRAALRQAEADAKAAGDERAPLVVAKDDNEEPVVYLRWVDFQRLLSRARRNGD